MPTISARRSERLLENALTKTSMKSNLSISKALREWFRTNPMFRKDETCIPHKQLLSGISESSSSTCTLYRQGAQTWWKFPTLRIVGHEVSYAMTWIV
ncbi:hypothetical protein Tco_0592974 [Tanacetum coccineum]|uniref:Uncharacterized protein n=1 Tax=Tanacetum coccineum TaxID=301880 RepID=A0ABQ5HYW7_9ASTR